MTPEDYRSCHEDTKSKIKTYKTKYLKKKKIFLDSLTYKEHNAILEEIIKSHSWGKAIKVEYGVNMSHENSIIIEKMWGDTGWNVSNSPGEILVIYNRKEDEDYDQEIFYPYKTKNFSRTEKAPIWVLNALIALKDDIAVTIYDRDVDLGYCNKYDRPQMWILDQLALRSY